MVEDQNEIIQMQEEIIESIQSQKLDGPGAERFIYSLFIVCGISMIFENFIKSYRAKKKEKKRAGESTKELTKKIFIVYLIHLLFIALTCLICAYLVKITGPYIWTLCLISVSMVEIAPLFTIDLNFKRKKE